MPRNDHAGLTSNFRGSIGRLGSLLGKLHLLIDHRRTEIILPAQKDSQRKRDGEDKIFAVLHGFSADLSERKRETVSEV